MKPPTDRRACLSGRWCNFPKPHRFAKFLWADVNGQVWELVVGPSDLVTVEQAALLLQLHRTTVYDMLREGVVDYRKYARTGGVTMLYLSDVAKLSAAVPA